MHRDRLQNNKLLSMSNQGLLNKILNYGIKRAINLC